MSQINSSNMLSKHGLLECLHADTSNRKMTASRSFSVSSFNCRSVKSSVSEVRELCNVSDLVFLQEHWLLPNELGMLNNLHPDFVAFSKSAVDISQNILIGRPYGGTAILFKKEFSNCVTCIDTYDSRICALRFVSNIGPILFVCVYMPADVGDAECSENFIETCSKISALYTDSDAVQLVVAGDFNCQNGSRFYDAFLAFVEDNSLQLSDSLHLNNIFTYCSDDGTRMSWIDHIVSSSGVHDLISNVDVLFQFVTSDHKPVRATFESLYGLVAVQQAGPDRKNIEGAQVYDWNRADNYCIQAFVSTLSDCLSYVDIPAHVFNACSHRSNDTNIVNEIDSYYNTIVKCIKFACHKCIPSRVKTHADYTVPGWNDYVKEKHLAARDAFLNWAMTGKPRQGVEFTLMNKTRAAFKLALRYCRQNEEQLRADSCANAMSDKDYKAFWASIHKQSNSASTKYVDAIGGYTGDNNIAEMWRKHFDELYNTVRDVTSQTLCYDRLNERCSSTGAGFSICVQDVLRSLQKQKLGKAVGPDNVAMEAFVFGGSKLAVHLCLLFNLFVKHGYLPKTFMSSLLVPLVKCKNGDLSDINNYRAIALSNALSKLFEHVLVDSVHTDGEGDQAQFGFKQGHSTALCTSIMKRTVEHYINRGSHVFACFVDLSKAFDKVNYWKLFNKLLDDNVNASIVRVLAFWYTRQEMCVCWNLTVSVAFTVSNGTRQGGVLSPYLFSRYIRDLLHDLQSAQLGCNIGGIFTNVLAYADDIVLLAPSWRALQCLLNVFWEGIQTLDMTCNVSKSVCMIFNPRQHVKIVAKTFPLLNVGGSNLQFVTEFKYLGHIISNDFSDDKDIHRELRNMFFRVNILVRRFAKCSVAVKIALFRAYCLCLYDTALWKCYNVTSFSKLASCYNRCIKIFFGYKRRDSMTHILTLLGLPTFNTVISNGAAIFARCYNGCTNSIISHLRSLGY